ncbi:hypothetical protein HDU83_009666 [Entophlyctis luteolus]|nr:hypothetical protein HDU83_009666 [Entophlyctis luteolus]
MRGSALPPRAASVLHRPLLFASLPRACRVPTLLRGYTAECARAIASSSALTCSVPVPSSSRPNSDLATGARFDRSIDEELEVRRRFISALESAETTGGQIALLLETIPRWILKKTSHSQWDMIAQRLHPFWKYHVPPNAASAETARFLMTGILQTVIVNKKIEIRDCYPLISAWIHAIVYSGTITDVKHVHRVLSTIVQFGADDVQIRNAYLTMALHLSKRNPFLAWDTVKYGSQLVSDFQRKTLLNIQTKPFNDPVIRAKERKTLNVLTRTRILIGLSWIPVRAVFQCPKAFAVVKEIIELDEKEGNPIGDLAFNVMAKNSLRAAVKVSGNENSNSNEGEVIYSTTGIREFLQFACNDRNWTITSAGYGALIHNACRCQDQELATELFEKSLKSNIYFDSRDSQLIVLECGRFGFYNLAKHVYERFVARPAIELESTDAEKRDLSERFFSSQAASFFPIPDEFTQMLANVPDDDLLNWSVSSQQMAIGHLLRKFREADALRFFGLMKKSKESLACLDFIRNATTSDDGSPKLGKSIKETFGHLEYTFNRILYSLARLSKFEACMSIYKDSADWHFRITQETCTVLITAFAYRHPIEGNRFLEDLEAPSLLKPAGELADVYTYTALISTHIHAGRLDHAIELLQRMKAKGVSPNTATLNIILQGLCLANRLDDAVRFLGRMERANCPPDVTSFNTVINAMLKRSQWSKARALATKMEKLGIEWELPTFNIWINAHIRREGGDPSEAVRLYNEMQRAPYFYKPSSSTYDTQLYNYVLSRKWNEAEKLLRRMYGAGQTDKESARSKSETLNKRTHDPFKLSKVESFSMAKSYRILITGLTHSQKLDRAMRLYRELLLEMRKFPSQHSFSSIRGALIRCAAYHGNIEVCHEVYNDHVMLEGASAVTDAINSGMIKVYSNLKDIGSAIAWADKIIPGSGTGVATLSGARGWDKRVKSVTTGNIAFGRGCTYALMLAHAAVGNMNTVVAVHEQIKRLEAWGIVNVREERPAGPFHSINEANVLIECYGLLRRGELALNVWDAIWKNDSQNASSFPVPRGPASLSSLGLTEIFGVDRVTVSNILDALSFSNMSGRIDGLWNLLRSCFPLDLNNYISYAEALARRDDVDKCVEFVEQEIIRGLHGQIITPKVYWSVILANTSCQERIWGLMNRYHPHFEDEIREEVRKKEKLPKINQQF